MNTKKLLASVLSAAVVLGTAVVPVFADDTEDETQYTENGIYYRQNVSRTDSGFNMQSHPNCEYFCANGIPITIDSPSDSAMGAKITWTYNGTEYSKEISKDSIVCGGGWSSPCESTSITMNGGNVEWGIFGGGVKDTAIVTDSVKIAINDGVLNDGVVGGGIKGTIGTPEKAATIDLTVGIAGEENENKPVIDQNMIGGGFYGNVYGDITLTINNCSNDFNGSGSGTYNCASGVYGEHHGNTKVVMNGGTINGILAGGTMLSGDIYGDTEIEFNGGCVDDLAGGSAGYFRIDKGGKVNGNTKVTVNGGTILETVCGGSAYVGGEVTGNTEVIINGGTIGSDTEHSGTAYGIYGGSVSGAPVGGTATVKINGGIIKTTTVSEKGCYVDETNNGSVGNGNVTYNAVAQIGDTKYKSIGAAVAAAKDDDTIEVLRDSNGDGIIFPSGLNLTIDFGGHTYTHDGALVGSKGYESQMFQLLKDSTITFKNGKVTSAIAGIGIQNYSNLTLEDMTVELTTPTSAFRMAYTLSNNNGNTVLTGNTNIIASKNCATNSYAFDVYNKHDSVYPSVSVTLDEDMTGTIDGDIELSNDSDSVVKDFDNFKLEIKNGNINGKIVSNLNGEQKNSDNTVAKIYGGSFTYDVSGYCADGYKARFVNGKYTVGQDDSTDTISLTFEQDENDKTLYNIVLSGDGKDINRLNAAQFKFDLSSPNMTYEIKSADRLTTLQPNADEYLFYFDGKDSIGDADSGKKLVIGAVKLDGYDEFVFKATDGKVTATTEDDNLVKEFVAGGAANKGTLKIENDENMIKDKFDIPVQELTINVLMNHKVNANAAAYQDMTVVISGGNLKGKVLTYKLGDEDKVIDDTAKTVAAQANGSYQIKEKLTQNKLYTVTVSGGGYRTARYTVTMTEDKTMNLWNNVMTNEITVVDDVKTTKNFLAGEIVKDGAINIYDLSAVVAYFGKTMDTTAYDKFAKYDLNRDGKIDMMDISIVLTSWGE